MFSGGAALEAVAVARARRELTALVSARRRSRSCASATRSREVPVDAGRRRRRGRGAGPARSSRSTAPSSAPRRCVDTSTLSGEPLPVTLARGMAVLSGSANAGAPFDVRAERPAAESAYAALVRLVEQAQSAARAVRADGRPLRRHLPAGHAARRRRSPGRSAATRSAALAVVVVATPCPLILAAPIALVSGLSRAARAGVIVKGAGAIETLGEARTVLFDKTGTLTVGTPEVREVVALRRPRPPASCCGWPRRSTGSPRTCSAEALVRRRRGGPGAGHARRTSREEPGQGIAGTVDGRRVAVGSRAFLRGQGYDRGRGRAAASLATAAARARRTCWSASTAALAGVIVMADELRPDADTHRRSACAREGVRHVAMVSGDRRSVAERVGRELGVDRVYAEQSPEDKLEVVRRLRADPALRAGGHGRRRRQRRAGAGARRPRRSRWARPARRSRRRPPTR